MGNTGSGAKPKMNKLMMIVMVGMLWPLLPAIADDGQEADIEAIRSACAASNQAIDDHDAEAAKGVGYNFAM